MYILLYIIVPDTLARNIIFLAMGLDSFTYLHKFALCNRSVRFIRFVGLALRSVSINNKSAVGKEKVEDPKTFRWPRGEDQQVRRDSGRTPKSKKTHAEFSMWPAEHAANELYFFQN